MPMLPSGRQVAIQINIVKDLLDDSANPLKVHKVLAILEQADVYPYTDVLWLLPEEPVAPQQRGDKFLENSLPRPPGLKPVSSGFRLSQHEKFTADWSEEDKVSFWEFVNVRAAHLFEEALRLTAEAQALLRTESEGTTQLLVAWWDAGIHPVQEGAPVEEGAVPTWDTYDMLAAIGQMRRHLQGMQLAGSLLDDRLRLTALWHLYTSDMPQLMNWPDPTAASRAAAEQARSGKWLDAMTASARTILHRQCVYECVSLWDHLGEQLEQDFPGPAAIINLVAISPEANECFDR